MNKVPRRGPRVMHGASKLFAQARDLAGALAQQGVKTVAGRPVGDKEAQESLNVLIARLQLAERRVDGVRRVVDIFRAQATKLAPDDPVRVLFEQMLNTIKAVAESNA